MNIKKLNRNQETDLFQNTTDFKIQKKRDLVFFVYRVYNFLRGDEIYRTFICTRSNRFSFSRRLMNISYTFAFRYLPPDTQQVVHQRTQGSQYSYIIYFWTVDFYTTVSVCIHCQAGYWRHTMLMSHFIKLTMTFWSVHNFIQIVMQNRTLISIKRVSWCVFDCLVQNLGSQHFLVIT